MLPIAPYNTWPLHVKLFTEEAKKLWDEVQQPGLDTPLPRGFTYSMEYEGVDGKSPVTAAQSSKPRTGPIDVKDGTPL
jgi:structure-specific endonuclease subunit SLX1